jgi:type II secretory pathway predicted ATPase ExeA
MVPNMPGRIGSDWIGLTGERARASFLEALGLRANPFDVLPLTEEQLSELFVNRKNELRLLQEYVGAQIRGAIAIVGERGVGKTTILRMLLSYLRSHDFLCVEVDATASRTVETLFRDVSFGIAQATKTPSTFDQLLSYKTVDTRALRQLSSAIEQLSRRSLRIVVAIDELNKYQESTDLIIDFARTILRYSKDAVFLFVAQPELEQRYYLSEEKLRESIVHVQKIKPFSEKDMVEMIHARLARVRTGHAPSKDIFTKDALSLIFEVSQGNPREALSICGNALIHFALKERREINANELSRFLYETQVGFLIEHLDNIDQVLIQTFAQIGDSTNHLDPRVKNRLSAKGLRLKPDTIYRRLRDLAKQGLLIEKEVGRGKPNLYAIRSDLGHVFRSARSHEHL